MSPPTAVHFGVERRIFYVPQDLLQNLERIASPGSSFSPGRNISLPDVDANTGHVLVHYLYTGTYQTLCNKDISRGEEINIEFKQAISTYVVAKDYQFQGLKQLAKQKVEQLGTKMSIYDIVNNVKEDFSKLSDEAFWFKDYMYEKVKAMFEQDYTAFARTSLFDCTKNVSLTEILAKFMVELYNDKIKRMINLQQEQSIEDCAEKECTIEKPPIEDCAFEQYIAEEYVEQHVEEDVEQHVEEDVEQHVEEDVDQHVEHHVEKCATDQCLVEEPLTPEASTEEFPVAEDPALTSECATEPEPVAKGDVRGEVCPVRARHLLGQEWETCRKCRAMVRQVTIELAHALSLDDSGYEKADQVLVY
ncbi:hypothetical protein DM02DRAFT_663132 [Periconia macrospinosa]|uniref:BTB domain-containing protein n=1 Tax=Periconia macrospinosa TaxID=97972 RepID=A0A2V1D2J9_9PLEO|nr:hypothetical protein DM02DRAFT_663132 [Periconia macrospinosa]